MALVLLDGARSPVTQLSASYSQHFADGEFGKSDKPIKRCAIYVAESPHRKGLYMRNIAR
jgi:hypothetical protein